jgi:hypothetical protein
MYSTLTGGKTMTKHVCQKNHHEYFEYHGNTAIERVKRRGSATISREWILFDTVEEAQDFFNNAIDVLSL